MSIQKVSFKSKYIFPNIKSINTTNVCKKNFISIAMLLADRKKCSCGVSKKGLKIDIIDKYDIAFEKIANFYKVNFIKK